MSDPTPNPADLRVAPRKAMFVAAELHVGAASTPVKIRNMSASGALVEGSALPPTGTPVLLVRGPLTATGEMSWAEGGRGGVALIGAVTVEDWIKGKRPQHQARVDALIAEIRKSGREPQSLAKPPKPSFEAPSEAVDQELRALATLIGHLEDSLINDPHVIAQHGDALQKIDEAQQRIAALVRRTSH